MARFDMTTALGIGALLGGGTLLWHFSRPASERVGAGDTVVVGYTVTAPGDRGGGIIPQRTEARMRVTSTTPENVTGQLLDLGGVSVTVPRSSVLRFV